MLRGFSLRHSEIPRLGSFTVERLAQTMLLQNSAFCFLLHWKITPFRTWFLVKNSLSLFKTLFRYLLLLFLGL